MKDKIFIGAEELLLDSFRLGVKILNSEFIPDYIVAIWRGGTPVGIAVQELLDYAGIKTDHIAIRTSHYVGIDQKSDKVQVHGLGYLIDNINYDDSLLVVDDVFDTGKSIATVIEELKGRARKNCPRDIRIATPWYKPAKNTTNITPDYFIHETDQWLVFPHELQGLSVAEVQNGKKSIAEILKGVLQVEL
ncbi:MAG: hypoxanthine phosphoribosyltransferase [Acidiferrobacteraceae bacterium]|nr:hypoxanthine phosphoribosyltransferase [Acidiferrobacteraceae bacterium]